MARTLNTPLGPIAHIRFNGTSRDVELSALGVSVRDGDPEIRLALARFLEVTPRTLDGHVLERHATGNLTLRPEAVFG